MTLADELAKVEQMHDRGTLTDDEFARTKARLIDSRAPISMEAARINGFRRSKTDRWLGGLCGGMAVQTGVDSWVWRIIFTLLFFACGFGILLYILFWIFVPSD